MHLNAKEEKVTLILICSYWNQVRVHLCVYNVSHVYNDHCINLMDKCLICVCLFCVKKYDDED